MQGTFSSPANFSALNLLSPLTTSYFSGTLSDFMTVNGCFIPCEPMVLESSSIFSSSK